MSKTQFLIACVIVFTATAIGGRGAASDRRSSTQDASKDVSKTMDSGVRAAAIIQRAINAVGGPEILGSIKSVEADFEGEAAATFQGLNPKNPHRQLPRTGDLLFDIIGPRLITFSETKWPNFSNRSKVLFRDGKTFTLDDQNKTYRTSEDDEVLEAWTLRLLPAVLKRLIQNPLSSQYGGVREIDGRKYDVIVSNLGTKRVYSLYFSQGSGLPELIENLDYSSDFGDITVRRTFADFRKVDGVLIPATVRVFNNEHQVFLYSLKRVSINPKNSKHSLEIPAGYSTAPRSSDPPKMQTRRIADDVYLIENLAGRDYNVMFADMGDFLIVFEAPIDIWASKIAVDEIRKVFPQKPIKYVMVTHFHDDHAAGIRRYMANDVIIITTPGNRAYFETVGRLRHTFHPENSLLKAVGPKFELVRDKYHEIKGANISVRFLDLGPTAHVDENIVAYIPERGIIFQGDYFRVPPDRSRPEPIRDEGIILLQKLKEKGLTVKQLVGAHGQTGDLSDLERSLALRKNEQ